MNWTKIGSSFFAYIQFCANKVNTPCLILAKFIKNSLRRSKLREKKQILIDSITIHIMIAIGTYIYYFGKFLCK